MADETSFCHYSFLFPPPSPLLTPPSFLCLSIPEEKWEGEEAAMNHARLFLPLKKGGGGEGGRRERMDWTNGEINIWLGPGNAVQDVSVKAHNPTVFFKLDIYHIVYCQR